MDYLSPKAPPYYMYLTYIYHLGSISHHELALYTVQITLSFFNDDCEQKHGFCLSI